MKETWYSYAPHAMTRIRRRAMARTLALFALTIASGLAVDRVPAYRDAIAHFEMGRAFLFTLPAIGLALVTYFSGWDMRRQQSESLARYRITPDALEREGRGEEPERIPWDRVDHLEDGALVTKSGVKLPFYASLIQEGAHLLATLHGEVARRAGASSPPASEFSNDDVAPGPERTAPAWPARLPRPSAHDHAAWAAFYERAVKSQEVPAGDR